MWQTVKLVIGWTLAVVAMAVPVGMFVAFLFTDEHGKRPERWQDALWNAVCNLIKAAGVVFFLFLLTYALPRWLGW